MRLVWAFIIWQNRSASTGSVREAAGAVSPSMTVSERGGGVFRGGRGVAARALGRLLLGHRRSLRCSTQERSGPRFMPGVLFGWYKNLRLAHIDAVRLHAAERAERMRGIDWESGREEDVERKGILVRSETGTKAARRGLLGSRWSFWWWGPFQRWRLQDLTTY